MDHNETSYYLYDGRGSVTANTWHNGMVTEVYQYDPYGQVTHGSTEHTDFYGYNGESYNPNTGLEYLRARYYNANQGRFFQEDTYLGDITDPLTLNRYAYVKNSPMNYVDPSGHLGVAVNANRSYSPYEANAEEALITMAKEMLADYEEQLISLDETMDEAQIAQIRMQMCYLEKNIDDFSAKTGVYGETITLKDGHISDQRLLSKTSGSFGISGSLKDNGCGWISLYNVLQYLGEDVDPMELLFEVNIENQDSTNLYGKLGMQPKYVSDYLEEAGYHVNKHKVRGIPTALKDLVYPIEDDHDAFIILYSWRDGMIPGAHYQAANPMEEGGLQLYNFDEQFTSFREMERFKTDANNVFPPISNKVNTSHMMTLSIYTIDRA